MVSIHVGRLLAVQIYALVLPAGTNSGDGIIMPQRGDGSLFQICSPSKIIEASHLRPNKQSARHAVLRGSITDLSVGDGATMEPSRLAAGQYCSLRKRKNKGA